MDTRKTIPNLRKLEKYAVRVGGGVNHREGLWEGILIKDNHLRAAKVVCQGRVEGKKLEEIFKVIRSHFPDKTIEIEVENIAEFKEVATYKPDIILLDNFDLDSIKEAVKLRNSYFPAIKLEVSGGVNLDNVEEIVFCCSEDSIMALLQNVRLRRTFCNSTFAECRLAILHRKRNRFRKPILNGTIIVKF